MSVKWVSRPAPPLYDSPDQQEFLAARRLRTCRTGCKDADGNPLSWSISPPNFTCPICGDAGLRHFNRLTIIAGRRFGKTRFGAIAALEEALIPNSVVWACAPSNPKLHRYIIPAFEQIIPAEWVKDWNKEFGDLTLINGSLIHFQTLEHPDQGRGQGLNALWIDEVCELTKAHWDVIRPSLTDKQGVAFFTTSPRSYDWVWKKLFKPGMDKIPGYWALHAKTSQNPLFQTAEHQAALAEEKRSMSDEMYRQEYEADFVTFTGAVYGKLLESQILRDDAAIKRIIPEWPQIDPFRPVIMGLDTGADHPFGGVKIVSTEHGLVVVGEYLERNRLFATHAGDLKRIAGSTKARWAINKNERQPINELAQHGIFCLAAENDVVAGTERVKSWLHAKQLWFIDRLVPTVIEQMRAYRWAENTSPKDESKRKEKVYKKDDELPDCIRYALMTWPQLPKPPATTSDVRDISALPVDVQRHIIIERKATEEPKDPATLTGDFFS